MKTRKILSLTRSRQISALCWAVILAAGLCARQFPVKELLPLPLRVLAAALLVVTAAVVIATSLGLFTERGGTSAPPGTSTGRTPPCSPCSSWPWGRPSFLPGRGGASPWAGGRF